MTLSTKAHVCWRLLCASGPQEEAPGGEDGGEHRGLVYVLLIRCCRGVGSSPNHSFARVAYFACEIQHSNEERAGPGSLSTRPVQLSRLTRKRDPNRERGYLFVSCIALRMNLFRDMQPSSIGKLRQNCTGFGSRGTHGTSCMHHIWHRARIEATGNSGLRDWSGQIRGKLLRNC